MSLLDAIKKGMQNQTVTPATGQGEQVENVRGLLRAKTGKQVAATGGPRQSAIAEKIAESQNRVAAGELAQQGKIQAAQVEQREADIEQRESQQFQEFQQNREAQRAQAARQTADILSQFENGQKTLQNDQDIQDLEQVGFDLRLNNKQYIQQLQNEGRRKRLDNAQEFKIELAKQQFGDQEQLLKDEYAFREIMDMEDREFRRQLSNIDINAAMEIANNAIKGQAMRQQFQAGGDIVTTGIEGYGTIKEKDPDFFSKLFGDDKGQANTGGKG